VLQWVELLFQELRFNSPTSYFNLWGELVRCSCLFYYTYKFLCNIHMLYIYSYSLSTFEF
jgi:hypothetical protein